MIGLCGGFGEVVYIGCLRAIVYGLHGIHLRFT